MKGGADFGLTMGMYKQRLGSYLCVMCKYLWKILKLILPDDRVLTCRIQDLGFGSVAFIFCRHPTPMMLNLVAGSIPASTTKAV